MEEIIRIQRATVDEHVREEIAKNWPGVHATFVQDEKAFYDVVPLNTHFAGIAGVKDFYRVIDAALPDFDIHVLGRVRPSGCSIREVTISGTHRGDYFGIAPTGKKIRFQLAAFFLFRTGVDEGKLLAERIYFDNETILKQLRGELDPAAVADYAVPALNAQLV
ncbi:MAG: ester cyclase [Bryobacteraceae bacterium]